MFTPNPKVWEKYERVDGVAQSQVLVNASAPSLVQQVVTPAIYGGSFVAGMHVRKADSTKVTGASAKASSFSKGGDASSDASSSVNGP